MQPAREPAKPAPERGPWNGSCGGYGCAGRGWRPGIFVSAGVVGLRILDRGIVRKRCFQVLQGQLRGRSLGTGTAAACVRHHNLLSTHGKRGTGGFCRGILVFVGSACGCGDVGKGRARRGGLGLVGLRLHGMNLGFRLGGVLDRGRLFRCAVAAAALGPRRLLLATAGSYMRLAGGVERTAVLNGLVVGDHAAAVAGLAVLAEDLQQAGAHALSRHLHQAKAGDLGNLVLGPVAAQAFDQAAEHQVAVGLEHHVDEVDDDDAADVAQAQLANDFLGRLQVVFGDGCLEVAAGAGELAGVDVDNRHGFGAVDDQRAARGQEDLAVKCLGDLLVERYVLKMSTLLPTFPARSIKSGATWST